MVLVWRDCTPPGDFTDGYVENYKELTKDFIVSTCQKFLLPFPVSTLNITTDGEAADFFYAGPMFIASGKMCQLLKDFDVGAEFLGLNVEQQGNPYKQKEYFFVNILDAVECFDFEKSEYSMTDHGVRGIKKLVLDPAKAAGHHLFLVGQIPSKNPNPRAVRDIIRCASEELATAITKSGLTGVVFVKPEHWRDHPATNVAWTPEN